MTLSPSAEWTAEAPSVDTRPCAVRLWFAEPSPDGAAGRRVFDVSLQGRKVLEGFDPVREAGGARRSVMREFADIAIGAELEIGLTPRQGAKAETLLCGVEILEQTR